MLFLIEKNSLRQNLEVSIEIVIPACRRLARDPVIAIGTVLRIAGFKKFFIFLKCFDRTLNSKRELKIYSLNSEFTDEVFL